MTRTTVCFM